MKQRHFIDSHKGITILVMLGLMAFYDRWDNPTAWVYTALHGGYGILWVLKSRFFPDRQWEKSATLGYGLIIWGALTLYWVGGWWVNAQAVKAPPWYLALCVLLYLLGLFLHFVSDMQKYISLKLAPDQLITEGLWAYTRNPNYLGELLIYVGFGLLAMHWLPIAILGLWIAAVWLPNMARKDRVLATLPGFDSYKMRTKKFIPFIY